VLQFINDEVVVAFGRQPARHPPGSGTITGIVNHPGDGCTQSADTGIFPQPDARAGVHHPGSIVWLVAAERHNHQRYPGDQSFHHGAVAAVSDDGRAVRQDIGVAQMATFVLVPGAGGQAAYWALLVRELRRRVVLVALRWSESPRPRTQGRPHMHAAARACRLESQDAAKSSVVHQGGR